MVMLSSHLLPNLKDVFLAKVLFFRLCSQNFKNSLQNLKNFKPQLSALAKLCIDFKRNLFSPREHRHTYIPKHLVNTARGLEFDGAQTKAFIEIPNLDFFSRS